MVNFVEPSFQLLLISFCIFLLLLYCSKPYNAYICLVNRTNRISKGLFIFYFCLYAIYVIFAFNSGDFYSYWNVFILNKQYFYDEINAFEHIYNWYANLTGDYFIWRETIWGLATFILLLCAKKLHLDNNRLLLLSMTLFGFGVNVYSRAILGHTMLLLSTILLLSDNKSDSKLIGVILFVLSYFLHKSMYVNILFALLAFVPLTKKRIVFSLFAFPFLTILATKLINSISSGILDISLADGVGGVGDQTLAYAEEVRMEANMLGKISKFITYLPEYLVIFYLVNRVIVKGYFKAIHNERIYTYLFRLTYISIYIASLFAFVNTSDWIYIRFKYMAFFPLPFVLAKVWTLESKSDKWVRGIILLQIISMIFTWVTKLYTWYDL